MCKYLFKTLLSTLWGIYPEVALLDLMVARFKISYSHTVFPSSCAILHSHQQVIEVPVSPYACQQLFCWLFFFFLSFRNSAYNLDINHISDIWFANIFQIHPVDCLFILSTVRFDAWNLNFHQVKFVYSFLLLPVPLISHSRNCHQIQWCKVLPHTSQKVLLFYLLCLRLWSSMS